MKPRDEIDCYTEGGKFINMPSRASYISRLILSPFRKVREIFRRRKAKREFEAMPVGPRETHIVFRKEK